MRRLISLFLAILVILANKFLSFQIVMANHQHALLAASGDLVWAKSMEGTAGDTAFGPALDTFNNVYNTVSFNGTVDFDPEVGTLNLISAGGRDIFISKLEDNSKIIINNDLNNTISNDGFCTLRAAIINANKDSDITSGDCDPGQGTDNIVFSDSLGNDPILLTSALPSINDTELLDIDGDGRITIDGSNSYRVFYIESVASLTLRGLTVTKGFSFANRGGGAYNNDGKLTIINTLFSYNGSSSGGGVYNSLNGVLTVSNSTFYENSTGGGGGIQNLGKMTITNSTFASNHSNSGGGGIFNSSFPNYLYYRTMGSQRET